VRPCLAILAVLFCACGDPGSIVPPGDDDDETDGGSPGDDAAGDGDGDGDGPDAGVPDADPGPVDDPAHIFDLTVDEPHHFKIDIAAADWNWLKSHALLEEYRPCTVHFEGRTWENAAIRFKGDWGTLQSCFDDDGNQICPKLSMKLKFNEYDPEGRFFGMRKLVFNSAIRDATMMHEVISYYLFRALGVPAPFATHARLSVNGEWQGLFVLVEDVDKEFLQDHWGSADEGNLYKAVWPQWEDPDDYRDALETNESTTTDVSRMLELAEIAEHATDASFPAAVAGKLDLPMLARYLAVDRAVSNVDSIRTFRCFEPDETAEDCINGNYYWYEVPGGPTELIAWDTDYTLAGWDTDLGRSYWEPDPFNCEPTPYCVYFDEANCNPEAEDIFILSPQCNTFYGLVHRATWDDYLDALDELQNGAMALPALMPLIYEIRDRIEPWVMTDPYGPGYIRWVDYNEWLDKVVDHQLTEIETLLAEES
jgi:spore coat protein H